MESPKKMKEQSMKIHREYVFSEYESYQNKLRQAKKAWLRRRIIKSIEWCVAKKMDDQCIFEFLEKYAQKYGVTLTVPMICRVSVASKDQEKMYLDFGENVEKDFIEFDKMIFRKAGFSDEDVGTLFNILIEQEFF